MTTDWSTSVPLASPANAGDLVVGILLETIQIVTGTTSLLLARLIKVQSVKRIAVLFERIQLLLDLGKTVAEALDFLDRGFFHKVLIR